MTSPTIKKEKEGAGGTGPIAGTPGKREIKKEQHRDIHRTKESKVPDSEMVRDLKAQLK